MNFKGLGTEVMEVVDPLVKVVMEVRAFPHRSACDSPYIRQ